MPNQRQCRWSRVVGTVLLILAIMKPLFGESALMGWQTTTGNGQYVTRVVMTGPTARNKLPEKNGIFQGEFFSREGEWQSKLITLYKLSADGQGKLQVHLVEFTITPGPDAETVESNGVKMVKTRFETVDLTFEPEEMFVLVFKTKLHGESKDGLEMVTVRITRLFTPS